MLGMHAWEAHNSSYLIGSNKDYMHLEDGKHRDLK